MMGLGSYDGGGFPPSSSSNLSALAPSFTVDQFLPKLTSTPLLDLTQPPYTAPVYPSVHDWMASQHTPYSRPDLFTNPSSAFDSTPSSYPYTYPGSQVYDTFSAYANSLYPASSNALLFDQGSTISIEAKPHYPSYGSPEIHNYSPSVSHHLHSYDLLSASPVGNMDRHDHYAQSLPKTKFMQVPFRDGSWEGLVDLNHGELGGLYGGISKEMNLSGSTFYEDHMKQVVHASEGKKSCQFAHGSNIHGAVKEKQIESASTEQREDKSFLGKHPVFMPVDHSAESISGFTSLLPENYPQAPSFAVNSWNYKMQNTDSFTEFMGQHDTHLNNDTSVMKSFPGLFVRPSGISSYPIAQIPDSPKNVNIGAAHIEVASNDPSIVKEPYPFVKPELKAHNNAQPLWSYLKQNNQSYAESSSAKELEPSNYSDSKEDFLHSFSAESGVQNFNIFKDGSDMTIDDRKSINAVAHSSSESLDPYNPVVDSPCWKGDSLSSFSLLDTSEAISKKRKEEIGGCKGSDLQGPKTLLPGADDAGNSFSHRSTKRSVCRENENSRNCLAYSLNGHSDVSLLFTERGIADAVKDNSTHTKPSCAHTQQCFEDTSEPRKEFLLSSKSVDDSDYMSTDLMHHGPENIKLTPEIHAPADVANDEMLIVDTREDNGSSHVALHASEHVSCSTFSVANASSGLKLPRPCGEESHKELYAQKLVNSMVNFSELLLLHCSIDACHLREQHHKALKTVMNNLGKCIPKNAQLMESTGESMVTEQATSKFLAELPELHKGISVEMPMVLEATATVTSQLDPQHIQKEEKSYFMPNKKEGKHSDFVSARGDADVANHVTMTQEGKDQQVLLYKNLWLEAEASLCSLNCISRFNRIKTEMEKCNSHEAKENACTGKLPNYQVYLDPATINTSAPQAQDGPAMNHSHVISTRSHADDVMARYFTLKSRNGHPDSMKIPYERESSSQDSQHLNIIDKLASEVKGATSNSADDILARFRIIKSQVEKSNSMNITGIEKLSSSVGSPILNEFSHGGLEVKDSLGSAISIKGSPIPSQTSHEDDDEASVMSRFHLLKCRVDNSSSMDMEKTHIPNTIDLQYENVRKHWPFIKDMSDGETEPVSQEYADATFTEDLSTSKGLSLQVRDDPVIQPSRTSLLGDQLCQAWYDGCSSDWELVSKECPACLHN
ncbi:uncharacterized protein LOC120003837 isoform X2 [Tripterygium wilfordii]|uniref:uncharacterized protein LOC120003837 isoform X2 n=1 Tax=Tripterygium wilfordii TaxID=458696 RepID=UPI0018F80C26|nr:uncharacterized protein LOC120003837 isoform X2 [Tripterygium wilfordii]